MPSFHLEQLESTSLSEQAFHALRRAILSGELPMGTKLVESRLVEQLGVSRAPVREALFRLAEQGLVVDIPRRGSFVQHLDVDAFVDLCNTRTALECLAVRLVVRGQIDVVAALEEHVAAMRSASDTQDAEAMVEQDFLFHESVCQLSGSTQLPTIFGSLAGQLRMSMTEDDGASTELRFVADRHVALIEILRAGDEDAAVAAFEEHILAAAAAVVDRRGGDRGKLVAATFARAEQSA